VSFYLKKEIKKNTLNKEKTKLPSVNIIGPCNLSFHNQHDLEELKKLFADLNIEVNQIIPENACVHDLKDLPKAWINIVPYREVGFGAANLLKKEFDMPYISTTPIGMLNTAKFIREIQLVLNNFGFDVNYEDYIDKQTRFLSQSAWFSRSIDCQNLIGKKAIVFGDSTHSAAITKILSKEMGIKVILAGTYCKADQDWFKEEVSQYCDDIIVTDDHNLVGDLIAKLEPEAIFGTQMERHVGKRLNIPCGVISAPVHIQNFPLSYRPFVGYEGANQIADLIYNSFTLGMEDHLLEIFGGHDTKEVISNSLSNEAGIEWEVAAQKELQKNSWFCKRKN
jgi:light-independent protochlorophyllide reductase subunit B